MKLTDFQNSIDDEEKSKPSSSKSNRPTKHIEVILDIVKNINKSLILEDVLELVLKNAIKITNSERGFIVLKNDNDELEYNLGLDLNNLKLPPSDFNVSMTVVEDVFYTGESKFIESAQSDTDSDPSKSILNLELETILCSPLITEDKKIGVIYVDSRSIQEINKVEITDTFEILAGQAATAIRNAQLYFGQVEAYNALQEANKQIVKAKEMVENSDRLKTEFLNHMSHEIRTPMNIISISGSYLKEKVISHLDDDTSMMFDDINNAVQRMTRTIDVILEMSQIQSGNLEFNPVLIDLEKEILIYLIKEYAVTSEEKNLKLIFRNDSNNMNVTADKFMLNQILMNIIDNAVKFTPKGKVEIRQYNNEEGQLCIDIKDTGIGISEEYMEHLYEPFTQEERSATRSYEGNGLGLAISKKYIDLNDITIDVNSKKNEGSIFRLIFPNS
jgi:signal transduction histidine kinase